MEALSQVEDGEMARSRRHPREVRERAVALVLEHQSEYASQWEAIVSVAGKVTCPNSSTPATRHQEDQHLRSEINSSRYSPIRVRVCCQATLRAVSVTTNGAHGGHRRPPDRPDHGAARVSAAGCRHDNRPGDTRQPRHRHAGRGVMATHGNAAGLPRGFVMLNQ
jgi:transposase-like protein